MPSAKCQFCALNTFEKTCGQTDKQTNKQTNKQTSKLEDTSVDVDSRRLTIIKLFKIS